GLALLLLHAIAMRSLTGGSAEQRAANPRPRGAAVIAALLLFLYALPFSLAYISIGAGTGALILFTAVQATMLLGAVRSGERFHPLEGLGLVIALAGLVYLVSPGLSAPSPKGSALMAIAGVAWGLYSLRGRGSRDPVRDHRAVGVSGPQRRAGRGARSDEHARDALRGRLRRRGLGRGIHRVV